MLVACCCDIGPGLRRRPWLRMPPDPLPNSKRKIHASRDHLNVERAQASGYLQPGRGVQRLVFVSGTGPFDPLSGAVVGTTIQQQCGQCLTNITAILEAAGSGLAKVVSATVILLDEADFGGLNEEWVKWFPSEPPARQAAKLPMRIPGMKVSIAVIAEA